LAAAKLLKDSQEDPEYTKLQSNKISRFVSERVPDNIFFSIPFVEKSFVHDYILSLSETSAKGLDDISAKLIKLGGPAIYEAVTNICNLSIKTNTFPELWKHAKVTPIQKQGNSCEVNNYRPISVLPILSKILEKHVHIHFYDFLKRHNLLSDHQFGFRPKHSCQTALLHMYENWRQDIQQKLLVGNIMIDFTKAFDLVDHDILIRKLQQYKCSPSANRWFASYLCGRSQKVCLSTTHSETKTIKYGVPQGSILGPLLFILNINDLEFVIKKSNGTLYADDTTMTASAPSTMELNSKLQTDLEHVNEWCNNNSMIINVEKTKCMQLQPKKNSKRPNT
jgi:hypothetical protein